MFNKNELIVDKVRQLTVNDLATDELWLRITQIENPSIQVTAEGDEVTDAVGSPITTIYRAKKAKISGESSLFSSDLLAAQYGSTKEVADTGKEMAVPTYEILTIAEGKVTLGNTPVEEPKYIYSIIDGDISTKYTLGETVTTTEFTVEGTTINVPTGLTGKVYVEYEYMSTKAFKIVNRADEFPKTGKLKLFVRFLDKCNDGLHYSGAILAPKAKINSESIETALTSTGKHPFEFNVNRDYCDEDSELLSYIIFD